MESRNKAEAERMIREQHQLRTKPEEADRRRDTVGRQLNDRDINTNEILPDTLEGSEPTVSRGEGAGAGSVAGSSDDALLPDPDAGGRGERGPAAYGQRGGMEGPEEANIRKSDVMSPNDDMAGEGWTLPEQKDEGWVLPQDPALEDRLDQEDGPEAKKRK